MSELERSGNFRYTIDVRTNLPGAVEDLGRIARALDGTTILGMSIVNADSVDPSTLNIGLPADAGDSIPTPQTLGQAIRQWRSAQGINATALSARTGISKVYISQLEHGRIKSPSMTKLVRLASAGFPVSEFLSQNLEDGVEKQ